MTKIKRNDQGVVIPYTLPEEYRKQEIASVEFLLENKRSTALAAKGPADIRVDENGMHFSYTLKEGDAVGTGIHIGEFQVTYADGTFISFPRSGYLEVDIQRNIDAGRSTALEDRIALKVSLIDEKFSDMVANNEAFKEEVETSNTRFKSDVDRDNADFKAGMIKENETYQEQLDESNEAFKNDLTESNEAFKTEVETLGQNISSLNEQQRSELDQRMGTAEEKVAAVEEEQSFQEKRIDNIMAESGNDSASAAELRDAHLGADGVARPNLGSMMREMHKQQIDANSQTVTLKRGLNLVQSDQSSPTAFEVQGQTRVNLLGDGRTTQSKTVAVSPTNRYLFIKRNQSTGAVAKEFITGKESVNRSWVADEWATLFQLTTAEYTEALTLTDAQLAEKYPYIDGVQHVRNPVLTKKGKNLLNGFERLVISQSVSAYRVLSQNHIELDILGNVNALNYISAPVSANTNYTFSLEHDGVIGVFTDSNSPSSIMSYTDNQSVTFNSGNNTSVRFYFRNQTNVWRTYSIKNPQLEIGTKVTPFQPQNNDHLYFPDTILGSSLDGTVRDSIYNKGGKYVIRERIKKDIFLDSNWNWRTIPLVAGIIGFKRAGLDNVFTDYLNASLKHFLNNLFGKPIEYGSTSRDSGRFIIQNVNPTLIISIQNEDTGFTDSYEPSTNDWKRFFNGWKYTSGTMWQSVTGNGQTATAQQALDTKPSNYTVHKLSYELATPVERELTVEGEIGFHSGTNLVELGEGVTYTEKDGKRTYTILPANQKYNMTTAVTKATATYNTNQKTVQDALVQGQTDMKAQINVQALQLLEVFARLRAGGI